MSKKTQMSKEPPTLSGFKKLKSLAVLDIDTLDVVTELKTCVRNSSGTLTKLKLSFSDTLANQARKPPPDMDPDDSDPDDEFQVVPVPAVGGGYNDDVSGPARAFRAQEEKKSQESVLGRIFDVEPYVIKKAPKKPREKEKEAKEEGTSNPGAEFINAIKVVSGKLMRDVHGIGINDYSASQEEILATIEYAARKYVASEEAKSRDGNRQGQVGEPSLDASSSQVAPKTSVQVADASTAPNDSSVSLFGQPTSTKVKEAQKDIDPDDIDIVAPEEQLVDEPTDAATTESPEPSGSPDVILPNGTATAEVAASTAGPLSSTDATLTNGTAATKVATSAAETSSSAAAVLPNGAPSLGVDKAMGTLAAQKDNSKTLAEKQELQESRAKLLRREIEGLRDADADVERIAEAEQEMEIVTFDIKNIQKELSAIAAEINDAQKQVNVAVDAEPTEGQGQHITEYLRATRGLALQSLGVYLIPVRPSVLSRAIDFRVLRRITLLNVGPQAPIWAHLHKENKESPLPLRKIFTDNVSQVFLTFVSTLEELHEFFILERDSKYKPESFAPKTNTNIDQIRRLVLKKHMPTLKRLMIKNMSDTAWDVNEKAVLLICRRGKELQELACNMGIRVIVSFMLNASD